VPGLVLVLEDDLLFGSRLESALRASAYRGYLLSDFSEFTEALKASPVLILVNAGSGRVPWPEMVSVARERRLPPHAPVIGYGPHTDLALRQRALDAGCDVVVARSLVANSLPSLLEQYAWKPDLSVCDQMPPPGVLTGFDQFNRREFYECHESIELVWMDDPWDVRLMYQGILQIGVAFYHAQQGNWPGMVKALGRGKGKLLPFLPGCQGVDVAALLADTERAETELRRLGPQHIAEFEDFPLIRVAGR
jgi:hypothetical protein